MRLVACAILILLTGCVASPAPPRDLGPQKAWAGEKPQFDAGQWWEWTTETYVNRTENGVAQEPFRRFGVERVEVLHPDLPADIGPVTLLYGTVESGRYLSALANEDMSVYHVNAWWSDSCRGAKFCLLPLAGSFYERAWVEPQFPLLVGNSWTNLDDVVDVASRVAGNETVETPVGKVLAAHIVVDVTTKEGYEGDYENPPWTSTGTRHIDIWYSATLEAPVKIRYVAQSHTVVDKDVGLDVADRQIVRIDLLRDFGRGTPTPLADVVRDAELEFRHFA